ncbi:hypothetical protein GCM10010123_25400 [Pilimelia anulata]|uniref:HTH tetR-type domain-containing protein n=1 Tax=Pilimelia anulata TaxID=53371 RepID=A0A8J3FD35_9ACTN|nr:TetR/AcrR family transcriptional regulator [Pilimelia anulata]GGJ94446.1 hypothetical protein GCM10010123_25400 [Pilimelia anulata]
MPRQTRQQVDDEIIDCAATLFARHGLRETSIQRIADAVGYSKSGLLRHYPSKEALQEAVAARCLAELADVARGAAGEPPGPGRDRAALTGLAHLALRRPGFIALLLAALLRDPADPESALLEPVGEVIAEAFALAPPTEPDTVPDLGRAIRVAGAVGALAVARTALRPHLTAASAADLIDVAHRALGHPAADAY